MKKWIASIVILVIALSIFIWCRCTDSNKLWIIPLSEADKTHLKNKVVLQYDDIIFWDAEEAWAEPYYGTINNCVILQATRANMIEIHVGFHGHIEIAGYVFESPNAIGLYAYRDGEVCELKEAYEKGWLTKEHIEIIHERHLEIYAEWLK